MIIFDFTTINKHQHKLFGSSHPPFDKLSQLDKPSSGAQRGRDDCQTSNSIGGAILVVCFIPFLTFVFQPFPIMSNQDDKASGSPSQQLAYPPGVVMQSGSLGIRIITLIRDFEGQQVLPSRIRRSTSATLFVKLHGVQRQKEVYGGSIRLISANIVLLPTLIANCFSHLPRLMRRITYSSLFVLLFCPRNSAFLSFFSKRTKDLKDRIFY